MARKSIQLLILNMTRPLFIKYTAITRPRHFRISLSGNWLIAYASTCLNIRKVSAASPSEVMKRKFMTYAKI